MLLGGTLLGATVTVGLAATILYVTSTAPTAKASATRSQETRDAVALHPLDRGDAEVRAGAGAGAAPGTGTGTGAGTGTGTGTGTGAGTGAGTGEKDAKAPGPLHAGKARPPEDALAHEAALVDQARTALARGDARGALRAIRATGALRERQLLPEELTVEKQALRRLGRVDQADAVEADLKAEYPESALAR
jgi:hypothetical protein